MPAPCTKNRDFAQTKSTVWSVLPLECRLLISPPSASRLERPRRRLDRARPPPFQHPARPRLRRPGTPTDLAGPRTPPRPPPGGNRQPARPRRPRTRHRRGERAWVPPCPRTSSSPHPSPPRKKIGKAGRVTSEINDIVWAYPEERGGRTPADDVWAPDGAFKPLAQIPAGRTALLSVDAPPGPWRCSGPCGRDPAGPSCRGSGRGRGTRRGCGRRSGGPRRRCARSVRRF